MIAQKSGPIYIDPETIDSEEDEIVNYPQCKTGQTCSDVVFFDVVNSASFKRCRFSANVQYQSVSAPSFLAFLSLLFESTVGGYIFLSRVGFYSRLLVFYTKQNCLILMHTCQIHCRYVLLKLNVSIN